ncbi:hypothetical protein CK203_017008 [Vitis vinifera]|uniref:Uncharacterized protein n=1 Tax=Vitis vinifera TaxID=29760 RepID=A0A438JND8_VITVI|nr:hypothetical protein CK203_017008 [Vitis vinifera]
MAATVSLSSTFDTHPTTTTTISLVSNPAMHHISIPYHQSPNTLFPFNSNPAVTASYSHEFEFGSVWVRVMRAEEIDITANLLAESFAVSLLLPIAYVKLLAYLVKQYLIEKRALMPHTATLVGFYKGVDGGEEEEQLAGTVEVSFNKRGANASPPTPTPPKNSPYICNMTVREPLRSVCQCCINHSTVVQQDDQNLVGSTYLWPYCWDWADIMTSSDMPGM